ncbi:MAG: HupE/UreJ family protein [Solirubrobacterales bacterium]|nr:HupE/UreJ family protein [Solirubrobacterales bacterium]
MLRLWKIRWFTVVLVGLCLAGSAMAAALPASAHDNTSGSVTLTLDDERVIGTGQVSFAEIGFRDTTGDGLIDSDEIAAQEADVATTLVDRVRSHVSLKIDGQESALIGAGLATGEIGQDATSKYVPIVFATEPHDGDVSNVDLTWTFTSPTDEVVLSRPDGATVGQLGDEDSASFSLGARAGAKSFFLLGIDHIRFGPDHLLFLLVLTLAVAGTTISKSTTLRAVKVVTAFTAGHAISLVLAYFEVISVPAGVVEPAISMSIVVAALLVVVGRSTDIRIWIAGLIGLIHGLGFASSLASLGVTTTQGAPAIAAFNIGIDLAQTVVVLTIVAALWFASKGLADRMAWVRIPTAAFAVVVGLAWTATRLSGVAA